MGRCRVTEAGFEVVGGLKFAKALLLDPAVARKDLLNGARQVVVHNGGEDTAEETEGVEMGVEERLLLLAGIGTDKSLGGELGAHAEEVKGDPHPCDYGKGTPPVGLGLLSAIGFEDQEDAGNLHSFLYLYLAHVPAHSDLASPVSFFLHETCVDSAGGVTLLFGILTIFLQPELYCIPVLLENRIWLGCSTLILGELTLKDLPDRYPGMARFFLYLPDAFAVNPMCCPDVLVLIHRYHPFPPVKSVFIKNQTYQRSSFGWVIFR